MAVRFSLFVLLAGILIGCTTPTQMEPISTPFTQAVASPTVTETPVENTPTVIPPSTTPTPEPSPTPSPEPTKAPIDEHDMEIHSEDKMENQEFMGVKFNGSVIVDESASTLIKKVTLTDNIHAEFLARTFFSVWWDKGNVDHEGLPAKDDSDFKAFMEQWAKAQQSNEQKDWEAVQFTIWANDLSDGDGYVQEPIVVWPMCDPGETAVPEGLLAVKNFSNVLIKAARTENMTKWTNSIYNKNYGAGVNFDKNTIYFYKAVMPGYAGVGGITSGLANTSWWLKQNKGNEYSGWAPESDTFIALIRRGIKVENP